MGTLQGFGLVFFGAGLGGMLRHATNLVSLRLAGPDLPAGTFIVNLLGSLAIGGVAGYVASRGHGAQAMHLFLATGILGGFTTFSSASEQARALLADGRTGLALAYVVGTVAACLVAVTVVGLVSPPLPEEDEL